MYTNSLVNKNLISMFICLFCACFNHSKSVVINQPLTQGQQQQLKIASHHHSAIKSDPSADKNNSKIKKGKTKNYYQYLADNIAPQSDTTPKLDKKTKNNKKNNPPNKPKSPSGKANHKANSAAKNPIKNSSHNTKGKGSQLLDTHKNLKKRNIKLNKLPQRS